MHFVLVLAVALGSVQGIATSDHTPLPGCTVTLTSAGRTQQTVADVEGRYRFPSVEPGRYNLRFELESFEPIERSIYVEEGVNEQTPAELRVEVQEPATFSSLPCEVDAPVSVWDYPACADYNLDEVLIENMQRGDASAVALLRDRYTKASTYVQKHRIAEGLLRQVPDDTVYWEELWEHARNCVRFETDDGMSDEYRRWCEERGYDPVAYDSIAEVALWIIAEDPRSRELLLEMLNRDVQRLTAIAIFGLARQRSLETLPLIEQALERCRAKDGACPLGAEALVYFEHEDADRLAREHLDEDQEANYLELRKTLQEQ